jgi:hypothetical protein
VSAAGTNAPWTSAVIRGGANALPLPGAIALAPIQPTLVTRGDPAPGSGPARRTKIWEFNINLHCSIVGTCLSTGELRQILKKLGLAPPGSTDHELHGTAVALAARHDNAAKLLNKALDNRHKLAIGQFARLDTEGRVLGLWRDAVRRGEIPGAYWAALTHPATTPAIIREAFGDVHMLSHLVGAANRADIRRLCQLEADKTELAARLERQQLALHEAVVTRDARIRELREVVARTIAAEPMAGPAGASEDNAMFRQLVGDLERRLASETRRRTVSDARLADVQAVLTRERSDRAKTERACETLRQELDAIDASLIAIAAGQTSGTASERRAGDPRLDGAVLLYVGGRPHQVAHLRTIAERLGAAFLHHDGGIENHPTLLPGLTSRADLVLFPVDCISHDAAHSVKLLCRQAGKRFIPLRSASVTSLLAALRRPEVSGLSDAAD